jgi:Fe-S-cluster containining protein
VFGPLVTGPSSGSSRSSAPDEWSIGQRRVHVLLSVSTEVRGVGPRIRCVCDCDVLFSRDAQPDGVNSLESDLDRARDLRVADLADAIEAIGFECTRCGACCKAIECDDDSADGEVSEGEEHTATVFPDEVRRLQERGEYDWRDVARPVPYGLEEGPDGPTGETFEWALQTDDCGDCTFYREADDGEDGAEGSDGADGEMGGGTCTVYGDRPLVCRTYPFSVALGGTSQPMGEAVDREGLVRAHECEGLGRDISRAEAEELAATLKERAVRELKEAIAVREAYEPVPAEATEEGVVVHDSEGAKRPDGTRLADVDGSE